MKEAKSTQTQLPPLEKDIRLSIEEFEKHLNANAALGTDIMAVRPMVANNILCGIEELRRQLLSERAKVQELEDALLHATDGEENSEVAYNNLIVGGRERRAENARIDAAIKDFEQNNR